MPRLSGSKVKYFREKILQVLHVLAVFGLCVLRDTASTRSISRVYTANTAILAVFRGSILWNIAVLGSILGFNILEYCLYLRYSGILYCLYFQVLAVFRHFVLLIPSMLGVFQDLIQRGAVRLAVFQVLYCEVLLVRVLLRVFYSNAEVFRGLILWILGVLPSISDVCTAGTCTRG